MTNHRLIALPLIMVVALFATWSGYWYLTLNGVRKPTNSALEGRIAGWQLTCGTRDWGGYPFRIRFTCHNATLVHVTGQELRLTRLDALAQAYNLDHVIAIMTGPAVLRPETGAKEETYRHDPATASIRFQDGLLHQVSVLATNVTGKAMGGEPFRLERINLHARFDTAEDKVLLAAELGKLSLANRPSGSVLLDAAVLNGELAPRPRQLPDRWKEGLRLLAQEQVELSIAQLVLKWPDLSVTADGQARMSPDGFLTGRFKTRTDNLKSTIARLESAAVISGKDAKTASTVLGLFGGRGEISVGLRIEKGDIYWGPVKLGRHPPLF